ncbi:MAG TPA: HAD family hydrolase, partial [Mycobacteriales bacterium]|nr:HAD family hydrolase [Mycobacteriales bacterium]
LDVATARILELYDAPRAPADVTAAMAFLLQRMTELFRTELPVMPGALELVDAVRAHGLLTALVSSSYRVLVDAALETLGAERFDVTVAGDELEHGKPHPDAYLTACRRLGVEPAQTVALEDAMSGILSAEAAGCQVIAVPWLAPIDPAPGRLVVSSLLDVDAAALAASR